MINSPIYRFNSINETGINEVPNNGYLIIDNNGTIEHYIKLANTNVTPDSTIQDFLNNPLLFKKVDKDIGLESVGDGIRFSNGDYTKSVETGEKSLDLVQNINPLVDEIGVSGNHSVGFGVDNLVTGRNCIVQGRSNIVKERNNAVFGNGNISTAYEGFISGSENVLGFGDIISDYDTDNKFFKVQTKTFYDKCKSLIEDDNTPNELKEVYVTVFDTSMSYNTANFLHIKTHITKVGDNDEDQFVYVENIVIPEGYGVYQSVSNIVLINLEGNFDGLAGTGSSISGHNNICNHTHSTVKGIYNIVLTEGDTNNGYLINVFGDGNNIFSGKGSIIGSGNQAKQSSKGFEIFGNYNILENTNNPISVVGDNNNIDINNYGNNKNILIGSHNIIKSDDVLAVGNNNTIDTNSVYSYILGESNYTNQVTSNIFGSHNMGHTEGLFFIKVEEDDNDDTQDIITVTEEDFNYIYNIYNEDDVLYLQSTPSTNNTKLMSSCTIKSLSDNKIYVSKITPINNCSNVRYDDGNYYGTLKLVNISISDNKYTTNAYGYIMGNNNIGLGDNSCVIGNNNNLMSCEGYNYILGNSNKIYKSWNGTFSFSLTSNYIVGRDNTINYSGLGYNYLIGQGLRCVKDKQYIIGRYNIENQKDFIIGSGSSKNHRKNALEIDFNTDELFANTTLETLRQSDNNVLTTKEYLLEKVQITRNDFDAEQDQTDFEIDGLYSYIEVLRNGLELRTNKYSISEDTDNNKTTISLNDGADENDWILIKSMK